MPASGSVSPKATDHSPVATFGRSARFCASLPSWAIAFAVVLCTCTITRIPPWIFANSARICTYCDTDSPTPPYASGTMSPKQRIRRSFGKRSSSGIWPVRSISGS